jgi:hypothetical protein
MATVIERLNQAEQTIDKLTDLVGAFIPQIQAGKVLYSAIKEIAGQLGVGVGTFDEEIAKYDTAAVKAQAVIDEYRALRAQQSTPPTPPATS